MNRETAFHQRLDDGTVRDLDGDPRDARLGAGRRGNPVGHLGQTGATVTKDAFPEHRAGVAHDTDLVTFGAPVDTDKPFKIMRGVRFAGLGSRAAMMPSDPCTGARDANSPRGASIMARNRDTGSPQVLRAQGALARTVRYNLTKFDEYGGNPGRWGSCATGRAVKLTIGW